jgi:hypothetical protein
LRSDSGVDPYCTAGSCGSFYGLIMFALLSLGIERGQSIYLRGEVCNGTVEDILWVVT